ncbi:hypothetical protein L9F63_002680 [Diploptera punctata]|uniref:VWFD domain-containing protein n=1 Tax=Diploptera punctata TaxID=6984 RepID=A0AAD7ZS73_DIPPU|nr:hypothetical protein L9F63_002680 [Diploptera punctata]
MVMNAGSKCQDGSGQATVEGQLTRNEEYVTFTKNRALTKLCLAQMSRNHSNLLRACQNVTYHADDLKEYTFTAKYDKTFPDFVKQKVYQLYSILHYRYNQHVHEDPFKFSSYNNHSQLNVNVRMDNLSERINITLKSPLGDLNFTNIQLRGWQRYLLTENPRLSPYERVWDYELPLYNGPTCVFDEAGIYAHYKNTTIYEGVINTFDNNTFYAYLSDTKYTLMEVLENTQNLKKFKLTMNVEGLNRSISAQGYNVDLQLKQGSNGPEVYFYNKKIHYSTDHVTSLINNGQVMGYTFGIKNREVFVALTSNIVNLLYDNHRVLVKASNLYRNQITGLCGTMDGEKVTDTFISRQKCSELDVQTFINTYGEHTVVTTSCIHNLFYQPLKTNQMPLLQQMMSRESQSLSSSQKSSESDKNTPSQMSQPMSESNSSSSSSSSKTIESTFSLTNLVQNCCSNKFGSTQADEKTKHAKCYKCYKKRK